MARKEYVGGVSATTLASDINAAVTSLVVATGDGADFPTGITHDFVINVGRGTATEEVMLCTARSSDTFTVTRGYDGTTAVTHQAGETVEHCIDAGIVEALSALLHTLTTQGDLPYATADATWARLAKGTARQVLAMNSGATAPEWVASLQSLLTTQGDIVYASAANTPARLAKGTAGQVLAINSGATAPEWVAPPASAFVGCAITNNSTQAITTGNAAAVAFQTEDFDSDAFHDTSTNNSRITIPSGKGGKYQVSYAVFWQNGATVTGQIILYFKKNGTAINHGEWIVRPEELSASNNQGRCGTAILSLAAGDYIEVFLDNASGSTATLTNFCSMQAGQLGT